MTTISKRVAQAVVTCTFILPWVPASGSSDLPPAPGTRQEVIDRFKTADKNGDEKITRDEAEQSMPRVAMSWERIDQDKKGYITLEQLLIISGVND